jgi:hypothetical protein
MKTQDKFKGEAEALARIICLRFGAIKSLAEKAPEDISKAIYEALQSAYREGLEGL